MNNTITTLQQRLDYNNIIVQTFPKTHKYKIPCLHIYLDILNTINVITQNEKCLVYRECIIEPFQVMLDDYYDHITVDWYITKSTIQMTLNEPIDMCEYINLVEMFKDLLETIDIIKITYEKTILNINE